MLRSWCLIYYLFHFFNEPGNNLFIPTLKAKVLTNLVRVICETIFLNKQNEIEKKQNFVLILIASHRVHIQ